MIINALMQGAVNLGSLEKGDHKLIIQWYTYSWTNITDKLAAELIDCDKVTEAISKAIQMS